MLGHLFIWATYVTGCDGFWISLWLLFLFFFLWGKVTVLPRLLAVGQLLRPVVLVFEECLELRRGVLLFVVGCSLLCDRYVWLYWFSTLPYLYCLKSCLLFMHSALLVAMVSWLLTGLLGLYKKKIFPFSYLLVISLLSDVLCFVAVRRSAASWVILK